jgi:hypothetical protein
MVARFDSHPTSKSINLLKNKKGVSLDNTQAMLSWELDVTYEL